MFSTKPQDIAKFRETTNKQSGGFSTRVTFRCPRCKTNKGIEHRRRAGSHIKDGFICEQCKFERMKPSNSILKLAED